MLSDYYKGFFNPAFLMGVETNRGFIISVIEIGILDIMNPSYYVYTTESLSKEDLYDVHNIKFFISDYSDETISFEEYVNKFYSGGISEASLRGRKLDHRYITSRRDALEKIAYDLIYKDTEFKAKDWTSVIDSFIEDCIAAEMITREHLYYPRKLRGG